MDYSNRIEPEQHTVIQPAVVILKDHSHRL